MTAGPFRLGARVVWVAALGAGAATLADPTRRAVVDDAPVKPPPRGNPLGCGRAVPGGAGVAQAQGAGEGPGAVFSMTNNPTGNSITVFNRASDGTLTRAEDVPTGGRGTGTPEDSANGLILANTAGESPHRRTPEGPRSTCWRSTAAATPSRCSGTRRRGPSWSMASLPAASGRSSITVSRGVAYVLNAGTPMCTGLGPQPSITGFSFDAQGQLTPIPGSTRPLSGLPNSGCTRVAFDRTGNVLIVEEQQADVITTYTRNRDGTLSQPTAQQSTGNGPFGLTFTQRNQLLTTENFGAAPARAALPPTPSTSAPVPSRLLVRPSATVSRTPAGSPSPTTTASRSRRVSATTVACRATGSGRTAASSC